MNSPEEHSPLMARATSMPHWFTTTHWSIVALAQPDSPQAAQALEKLCRTYWLPLYSFVRRQGFGPHDAQDLTQGFFARLLRYNSFAGLRPEKGKFRTFLLAALKHYLSDEWDRARAEKRGGGQTVVSLDETDAEQQFLQMPSAGSTPENAFDRRWALTVLEQALTRLRQDYQSSGKQALFEGLSGFLSTEAGSGDYDAAASKVGMSPGAVSVAVHRLRQRYRECIRRELAETVSNPADLDEELKYLFTAIGG